MGGGLLLYIIFSFRSSNWKSSKKAQHVYRLMFHHLIFGVGCPILYCDSTFHLDAMSYVRVPNVNQRTQSPKRKRKKQTMADLICWFPYFITFFIRWYYYYIICMLLYTKKSNRLRIMLDSYRGIWTKWRKETKGNS